MCRSVHPIPHHISPGRAPEDYLGMAVLPSSPPLRQPRRVPSTGDIFHDMRDNVESCCIQEGAVFGWVETGVIERLAFKGPQNLAMAWAAGKQQRSPPSSMLLKDGEHPALRLAGKMKEAVPRENAVKLPAQIQRPHVRNHPLLTRKAAAAEIDESRRRVDSRDPVPQVGEITGDRLAGTATDIEDGSARVQESEEWIERGLFKQVPTSHPVERLGVPLI